MPEPIQSEIEAFKTKLFAEFNLKGALRSPAHITLHRPFEWKEEKEEILIKTLKNFDFKNEFLIELKNFSCFTPRVIYVDVVKNEFLFELHKKLKYYAQENFKLYNEVGDMRGFHPHVTIAFRDLKKNKFDEVWNTFKEKLFKADFAYAGFSLLKLEAKWEEKEFFGR